MIKLPLTLCSAATVVPLCSPIAGSSAIAAAPLHAAPEAAATARCTTTTFVSLECVQGRQRFWERTERISTSAAGRKPAVAPHAERIKPAIDRLNAPIDSFNQGDYSRCEELAVAVRSLVEILNRLGENESHRKPMRDLNNWLMAARRSGALDRAQQKIIADLEVFLEQEFQFKSRVGRRVGGCGSKSHLDGEFYDWFTGSERDYRRFMHDPQSTANFIQRETFEREDLLREEREKKKR